MKRSGIASVSIILFMTMLCAAAEQTVAPNTPARPLSDYFPANTIVFADCPSVPALHDGLKGTGLYALWNDDALAAIRKYVDDSSSKPAASGGGAQAFAAAGDLLDCLSGGLAAGAYQSPAGAEWLVVAEVSRDATSTRDALDRLIESSGSAVTQVDVSGVKARVTPNGKVYSAVADNLLFVGSKDGVASGLGRRNGAAADPTLSTSVNFVKSSVFLSKGPRAYRVFVDFPTLLDNVRKQLPANAPVDFNTLINSLCLGDIETASLEGAFQLSGVTEHIYVSTKSAESKLLDLVGRQPFDETRLPIVPRTALFASGRAMDLNAHYHMMIDFLKVVGPLGFDVDAMLKSFEERSSVNIERDVIPALGKTTLFYYDMPEGATLAGVAAGGSVNEAFLVEVKDAGKMQAVLERFASYAQNDPMFGAAAGAPAAKLDIATLGNLKIYYLTFPGRAAAPSLAVANGYLIYSSDKEAIKAVIDRLIAAGPSIVDAPDYSRVRQALPKSVSQIGYINLGRAIDFAYDNLLTMLATRIDMAHRDGNCPLTSADIPSAYIIKKHIDGIGFSCSASGNLVDMTIYTPMGGAVLVPAAILIPVLAAQANGPARAGGSGIESSGAAAGGPARDRLVEIGRKLQVATIERNGKFPDRIEDVVPAELLKAPQAGAAGAGADYIYVPGYTTSSAGRAVLVYERKGLQADGRHVLFVDGSVEYLSESDFEKLPGMSGK